LTGDLINYVTLGTNQSISGTKTFSSPLTGSSATFSGNMGIGGISSADIIGYGTNGILGILGAAGNPASIQLGVVGTAAATTTLLGDINAFGLNGGSSVVARTIIRSALDGATNSTKMDFFTMNGGSLASRLTIASTGAATFSSSVTASSLNLANTDGYLGTINSTGANGGYFEWRTSGTTIADIGTAQQIFGTGGNGTFGINARGARDLVFGTNNTERMILTASGELKVSNGIIYSNGISSGLSTQNREGSNLFIWIGYNSGLRLYNDALGFIGTFAATTGVYTANSDIRLKENIFDSTSALSTISKLKVKSYDWKHNGVHESFGLIAQDLYEVLPEYVFKPEDEDDNWGISKGELVPMLIKAIQELKAEIEELKAK
jgi:hypothetical protein